jgi:hypothetical protein
VYTQQRNENTRTDSNFKSSAAPKTRLATCGIPRTQHPGIPGYGRNHPNLRNSGVAARKIAVFPIQEAALASTVIVSLYSHLLALLVVMASSTCGDQLFFFKSLAVLTTTPPGLGASWNGWKIALPVMTKSRGSRFGKTITR